MPCLAFRLRSATLALPLLVNLTVAKAADLPPTAKALDALVASYHAAGQFNGNVLVVKDGAILLEKGYGLASFEQRVPNAPDTKHWFASVSKTFTATTVMRLVDRGLLRLDAHVSDLLPDYRRDTGQRVTVRMLLNHTSGIPDYMHLPDVGREGFTRQVGEDPIELKTFVKRWCSADLAFEPGSRWSYSNSGYVLLGAIIETVTGKPFAQVVREEILEPAGMKDTRDLAGDPRAVVEGLTPGYENRGTRLVTRRPWNLSTVYAAGGMVGPLRDLERFDRILERPDFLSATSRAAMFTEGLGHWGCGWEVRQLPIGPDKALRTVLGHEGYLFWTLARIYRVPEERLFIALINNTGDAPLPKLFEGLTDLLAGRTPVTPKPYVSRALRLALEAKGPEHLAARYQELKTKEGQAWDFSERVLNGFGYELLEERRLEAALAAFRINVQAFPESGNAWDSLGEGLATLGRKPEAIQAYRRAVSLDPSNKNAPDMLKRLGVD